MNRLAILALVIWIGVLAGTCIYLDNRVDKLEYKVEILEMERATSKMIIKQTLRMVTEERTK